MVGSLLLAGCEATSPRDVEVTASTSVSSIPVKGTVSIVLTVYNRSSEAIHVSAGSCTRLFEVLDLSRNVVGPAQPQVCALDLVAPMVIAPGASADIPTSWRTDAGYGPADETIYVSPGIYSIRPRILIEGEYVYGTGVRVTVTE